MRQQTFGRKARDTVAFRSEGHKDHRHPGRAACLAVGCGIADQHGPANGSANAFHRKAQGRGIGLSDSKRVCANHCRKKPANPKPRQQNLRQMVGLVGADPHSDAAPAQPLHRVDRARIKPGMGVDRGLIRIKQRRIVARHLVLVPAEPEPFRTQAQHRPAAVERNQRILWPKWCAMAGKAKGGIRRGKQIPRGIRQRSVQIEDHRIHRCFRHIRQKDVSAPPFALPPDTG